MSRDPRRSPGSRRRGWSLRLRVTLTAAVAVALMFTLGGGLLVAQHRRQLTESLDDALRQRADELATIVDAGPPPTTLAGTREDDTLAQVVDANGDVLAASARLAGTGPLARPPVRPQTLRTTDDLAVDDDHFRLLSRRHDGAIGAVVIHVAGSLDEVDDAVGALSSSLQIAIPVGALLLALLVWFIAGRTLRPVEAISAAAAEISGSRLDRRVPEPGVDDEIGRLARTVNAMLDRVEDGVLRQQRFVSDASHELRSPLARMRSQLEVDLAHPGTADPAASMRTLLDETVALGRLIDDLLVLARSDAGSPSLERVAVDLDDIVGRQARRIREDGRVAVDVSAVSGAQVDGDPGQLTRAVRNLADNAARHAVSTVRFSVAEFDGMAEVGVADDGPGIPPEARERVFDRFTRLDEARTAADGGTGLGLAIVRDIVERHGGSVGIDPDHHPGTRFVMRLPTTP